MSKKIEAEQSARDLVRTVADWDGALKQIEVLAEAIDWVTLRSRDHTAPLPSTECLAVSALAQSICVYADEVRFELRISEVTA